MPPSSSFSSESSSSSKPSIVPCDGVASSSTTGSAASRFLPTCWKRSSKVIFSMIKMKTLIVPRKNVRASGRACGWQMKEDVREIRWWWRGRKMSGLGAMFFRGSGGAGRRSMQGRGHIRRARPDRGLGARREAVAVLPSFALVTRPRALSLRSHEASCSQKSCPRGPLFQKSSSDSDKKRKKNEQAVVRRSSSRDRRTSNKNGNQ